jgi:hypothetical protein
MIFLIHGSYSRPIWNKSLYASKKVPFKAQTSSWKLPYIMLKVTAKWIVSCLLVHFMDAIIWTPKLIKNHHK